MSNVILLTGATGFVGRQILNMLEERGMRVHVVVRKEREKQLKNCSAVEKIIITQDIFAESVDWWGNTCIGVDTVIHVAWYAEPGEYLQSVKNLDCLIGTLQLAKGAVHAGVRRLVGVGTCFEYDLRGGVLSVNTPLLPLTPYAGAKAAVFTALSQWLPQQDVEFAWCRLFYLFGEGEDEHRFVPYVRSQLASGKPAELTGGNQIRDFLDVREAARMIVDIALSKKQGAVNICSGLPITIKQLAEKIADEYGRRDLLMFGVRSENQIDPACIVGTKLDGV